VLAGAVLLFPSLALLFRLVLAGRFDEAAAADGEDGSQVAPGSMPAPRLARLLTASSAGLLGRAAAACLLAGFGLLTLAEAGWAHAIGIVALLGFVICGFFAIVLPELSGLEHDQRAAQ